MPEPKTPDFVTIAEIAAPHGVRGEVRVTMLSDFPDRFLRLRRVFLHPPVSPKQLGNPEAENQPRTEYKVMGARLLGNTKGKRSFRMADPEDESRSGPWAGQINQALLKLAGINDMDAAEEKRNFLVQVPADEAWPLPEGHFYAYQIYDLRVVTPADKFIGVVSEIITTGANDVYVVMKTNGKELLVPAINEIVEEINPSGGFIRIKDPAEWEDDES